MKAINLIQIGRWFFAAGMIAIGIEHFIFDDFVMGRAPVWPEAVPGKLIWAYFTGIIFVLAGLAILLNMKARSAALVAGTLIFLWALLRSIPVIAADSFLSGEWTRAGKALTFFGGAFAIAGTLPLDVTDPKSAFTKFMSLSNEFIILGRICLGIFLVMTGIQHFLFTEFVASLIPEWFPGNTVFWTYFAGVALVAGGVGLFIPKTAWLAALLSGLMIFSWFWIVHIPRTFFSTSDGIAVFEALAVSGIAFVLAGFLRNDEQQASDIED